MARVFMMRRFRKTTLLLIACVVFLVGLGLASQFYAGAWFWWLFTIPLLLTLRRRSVWTVIWLCLFALSLGLWRGGLYQDKLTRFDTYYDHKVTVTAIATQDATYDKYKQLKFDAKNIVVQDTGEELHGKVSISGFGLNTIFAGDELEVTGKLKSSLGSYQGRMSFAQMTLVEHHNSVVNELRRRFVAGVQSALPEPLASFGMGLLVGQRNTLPEGVSQSLLMVGLTHIVAASGYNMTILLRSADKVAGKRSKRMKLLLSLSLIALFLLFAGTSASIVRAAIVSLLSIAAGYYGRSFKPLVLLLFAAALTAYANPYYVWSDIGWYLSFLAFYGVMILAPLVQSHWSQRWKASIIAAVALESICAEVMALPYILHNFGQMSFVGLLGNVLVVAFIPLAMLLTLIAGLAGMFLGPVMGWFAWPAVVLLNYMLDVANLLSQVPHAFKEGIGFSTAQMIGWYVIVGFLTFALRHRANRPKSAIITEKKDKESDFERSFEVVHNQA
jgi:competence protein ComEC